MHDDLSWLGPLLALTSSCTWALGSTAFSSIARRHAPHVINFQRAVISVLLIFISCLGVFGWHGLRDQLTVVPLNDHIWIFLSVLGSYAFGDVLFLHASTRIGISSALCIASLYPLWAFLAGVLSGRTPFVAQHALGLILVVVGTIGVIRSGAQKKTDLNHNPKEHLLGVILAFATSLLWATNSFAIARTSAGLSPWAINLTRLGMGLILIPLVGWFMTHKASKGFHLFLDATSLKKYWWAFVLEGYIGSSCFVYGLMHTPLALGVALTSLAPVISLPFSVAFGLEKPKLGKALAVIVVVAGMIVLVQA